MRITSNSLGVLVMSWWPRRRRRRWEPWEPFGPEEDIFEALMEEMTLIDEYIEKHFRRILHDLGNIFKEVTKMESSKPIVYGVTVTIGPDGKPRVERFGTVPKHMMPQGIVEEEVGEEREPLVEVVEDSEKVYVTVELPGVDKDKIELEVLDENKLVIRAEGESRKYKKVLELPANVDPDSIKATYKNGILDIIIKKKKGSGKRIKVE